MANAVYTDLFYFSDIDLVTTIGCEDSLIKKCQPLRQMAEFLLYQTVCHADRAWSTTGSVTQALQPMLLSL